jgi:hypothetical protein
VQGIGVGVSEATSQAPKQCGMSVTCFMTVQRFMFDLVMAAMRGINCSDVAEKSGS